MKKTKLLTTLAAFVLVLSLGACDEKTDDTTDEESETTETGETEDTSESTESSESTETGDTTDTGGNEGNEGNEDEQGPTLLGFEYEGINYYIDGTMFANYDYEGNITANIDEAIEVTCSEAENDGYYLTFELNNTTYYVCIIPVTSTSGTFTDLQYTTKPNAIYYDENLDGWVNDDGTYFLCYSATYNCFYASKISDYGPNSGSPAPIAHLYDYPTIEAIALSADPDEVYVTSTLTIDVTYTPSTIGASNLTWESSDNEKATVTNGVVTGFAEGEVEITATTLNGLTDTIKIKVVPAPADEELSIEITPESLAAEYGTTVSAQTNIVADGDKTSTYGGGAVTITWTYKSGDQGINPWNGVSNSNSVSTIRFYSGASFTVSNGTGTITRVVIDAAWSSGKETNGCGTSFSATNATVGSAVTTNLGDQVEITINSGATSTTISRSGSVCYCSGITLYYYA